MIERNENLEKRFYFARAQVLELIHKKETGLTSSQVARTLGMTTSTTLFICNYLSNKNLVFKRPNPKRKGSWLYTPNLTLFKTQDVIKALDVLRKTYEV